VLTFDPVPAADWPRREDLIVSNTVEPSLENDYRSGKSIQASHYCSVADHLVYVKIDGIDGLEGCRFSDRAEIEDAVDESLRSANLGCVFGGGTGLRYSYVDCAIRKEPTALARIVELLRDAGLPRRSWVLFFDTDRQADWIAIWPGADAPPV